MSTRQTAKLSRFQQLLTYPPNAPLLHVKRGTAIAAKRRQRDLPHPLNVLDPSDDA